MNNKKIYKIWVVLFVVVMILAMNNTQVYAKDDVLEGADLFLDIGGEEVLSYIQIWGVHNKIYQVALTIGSIIVVLVGAVIGIQFIMGSVEEKAKIKEMLIPYVVGTIIIFGAIGIWSTAYKIMEGVSPRGPESVKTNPINIQK